MSRSGVMSVRTACTMGWIAIVAIFVLKIFALVILL